MPDINDFIKEAATVDYTDPQTNQTRKLIVGFYELMNQKNFAPGQVKKFLEDNGYTVDEKHDMRSLKALHGATDALFDCGIKY
jgi:hypothetical protein